MHLQTTGNAVPNVFTPRADVVLRSALAFVGLLIIIGGGAMFALGNPQIEPLQGYFPSQPVMFSHQHHVGRLGLDCRYCHESVERSDYAGMPAAATCMNCHLQLYDTAEMLEPIRKAWRANEPVRWNRVYRLADFVRFSHQVHVNNGVACVSCHGRMDEQPLTAMSNPMTMGWCLDCHRDPSDRLVPPDQIFSPDAVPGSASAAAIVDRPDLLTSCSACHY